MQHFALLDLNNNIIREGMFDEQPGDPIGKGWRWVPIVFTPDPIPGEYEKLSRPVATYVDEQIVKSCDIEQIVITKSDINNERNRKLEKKYAVKLTDTVIVNVNMNQESLTNLHQLATMAQILISKNDDRTTTYRDADNVNHSLTPSDLIEVFLAVNLQIQSLYEACWLIKDDADLPANLKLLKQDPRWPAA